MDVAERSPMANAKAQKRQKTGRPGKPAGEPIQVRIDAELVPRAKALAFLKGVSMTDYLSGLLRPALEQDSRAAAKLLGEDIKP